MKKRNPENMGNPIVAMNFYNGGGEAPRRKRRLKPFVCPDCNETIPLLYAQCDCQKKPAPPPPEAGAKGDERGR